MEIIEIYTPYLYSIKYDGVEKNEFDRLFRQWSDTDYVVRFMTDNKEFLATPIWLNVSEPEAAAKQVQEEAADLEEMLEDICTNVSCSNVPPLDDHFQYLDGKFKYELKHIPMKSYGSRNPSFIRIYAIKLDSNIYLITGGGIKLADTIQNSPDLKDHVLQNIVRVRSWLKENGIFDSDDI